MSRNSSRGASGLVSTVFITRATGPGVPVQTVRAST